MRLDQFIRAQNIEIEVGKISDGYHTFDELYEHRASLFIALCRKVCCDRDVWRSTRHSHGEIYEGWFILGIGTEGGQQITYHLPISRWGETDFATDRELAPVWDGHTPADVLERLKRI